MPLHALLKLQDLLSVYDNSYAVQEKHRDPNGWLNILHLHSKLQSGLDLPQRLFGIRGLI